MITVKGLTVYFDVDQTLVMFGPRTKRQFYEPEDATDFQVDTHQRHVRALREHKHRGHKIVVWSAGGAEWAEQVVRNLGIEDLVDICIAKPSWFYDDKTASEFMPEVNRVYFNDGVTDDAKTVSKRNKKN